MASLIMFGEKKVGYSDCGIFYHVLGKKVGYSDCGIFYHAKGKLGWIF